MYEIMPPNWEVEARKIMFWIESSKTINFDGNTYNPEFAELRPERYEEELVNEIDDHTVELTVEDPNGLV